MNTDARKKRIEKIALAAVAAVLAVAMAAGIAAFALIHPVTPQGVIDGAILEGERASAYSFETRNYFVRRLGNWIARFLGVSRDTLTLGSVGDYFLNACAEAGIPADKVRGIADFLEEEDPSEGLLYFLLGFCVPKTDENGEEIEGEYVLDFNSDPTRSLSLLFGSDTIERFFARTLITPQEGGAILWYSIYNSLNAEDKALVSLFGRETFVDFFAGANAIYTNLDGFLTGGSAQEARIMYELVYTVGADLHTIVEVLGAERLENLFGIRADALRLASQDNVDVDEEQYRKLVALTDDAKGLSSFLIILFSDFMQNLTPEIFESYRNYTATGSRKELLYSALLTMRALSKANESAVQKGTMGANQAAGALSRITDRALEIGVEQSVAPKRTLLEVGARFYAFLALGDEVESKEDLNNPALYQALSDAFVYFEEIEGFSEFYESVGFGTLVNLLGFRTLTLILSGV